MGAIEHDGRHLGEVEDATFFPKVLLPPSSGNCWILPLGAIDGISSDQWRENMVEWCYMFERSFKECLFSPIFLAKCRCRLCLEKKEFEKYTQFFFLLFLKCSSISFFSQVECFRETTAPRIGFLSTAGKKAIRDVPLSLHSLPGNNICQPTQLLHRVNLSLGKHHKENI